MATIPCTFCSQLNRVDLSRAAHRPLCGKCKRRILLDRPVRLNDANFERVIRDATVRVVVDFYADWCAPCKIMSPILDEFAHEHEGHLLVGKLDTDQNPGTATRFAIRSIPTLIVFEKGTETLRRAGAMRRELIEQLLGLQSDRASA